MWHAPFRGQNLTAYRVKVHLIRQYYTKYKPNCRYNSFFGILVPVDKFKKIHIIK